MFTKLNLNPKYLVSKSGVIDNSINKEIPVINNKVKLNINDKEQEFDMDWIYQAALRNLPRIKPILDNLHLIEFIPVEDKIQYVRFREIINGKTVNFKKPIYYKDGYRIVPGYPEVAINEDGDVIHTLTGERLTVVTSGEYIRVSVKSYRSGIPHHRLLALAWIKNKDPYKYQIINHIDGDKFNNSISNLEWCDNSHNMRHANENQLNSNQTVSVRMRNYKTGEIKVVNSLSEASRIAGMKSRIFRIAILKRNPTKPFGDWEIKLEGDTSDWHYENKTKLDKHGRYTFHVTEEDGTYKEYHDIRDFIKAYKLWNITNSAYTLVTILRERRPGLKVSLTKHGTERKIIAYNIETNEKVIYPSARKCSEETGVSRPAITNACCYNTNKVVRSKWIFKYIENDNGDWTPNWNATIRKIKIEVTNKDTGEKIVYPSLREAARELNVCRSIIKARLKNEKPYENLIFKNIETCD